MGASSRDFSRPHTEACGTPFGFCWCDRPSVGAVPTAPLAPRTYCQVCHRQYLAPYARQHGPSRCFPRFPAVPTGSTSPPPPVAKVTCRNCGARIVRAGKAEHLLGACPNRPPRTEPFASLADGLPLPPADPAARPLLVKPKERKKPLVRCAGCDAEVGQSRIAQHRRLKCPSRHRKEALLPLRTEARRDVRAPQSPVVSSVTPASGKPVRLVSGQTFACGGTCSWQFATALDLELHARRCSIRRANAMGMM